ncbi:type II toxin-antitoxin system RelE/ParE family toxin, partial [Candidatus Microgenomates bacterium]|nr:type II toxin-antitoxin system RelE/ParE family toxin [Candidatus Microgenomates bacterium]
MEVYSKPSVSKQLKRVPKLELTKIKRKFAAIKEDPYAGKLLRGEFQGLYAIRAWPYRIVYEVRGKKIIIL